MTLCVMPRHSSPGQSLTGAMVVALGSAVTGVYTNSSHVWQTMQKVGGRVTVPRAHVDTSL